MSLTRRELFTWRRRPAEPQLPEREPTIAPRPATRGARRARPAAIAFAIPPRLVPTVLPAACLATTSFCSVCVERCPRPGAIVVDAGRPRVVADACDGCGRCVAACPAPTLALTLVPRPTREGATR